MGKKFSLAFVLAMLVAFAFPLTSQAQATFMRGQGSAMRGRPHIPFRSAPNGAVLTGRRARGHARGYRSGIYPYLYPYYYSDYYYEPRPAETQPERVVVVENPQPRAEVPPPSPPPESLVLELQGNHWVRITDSGQTMAESQAKENGPARTASLRTITPQQSAATETAHELPPAVLVFRDGHQEEITRYSIVGATIYTTSEYWNNGSWTKKVPIAELNVPATLELNRQRGANFSLPSGPHVVVIRP